MVSEKKGRGSAKLDGRGVIRTEADEGEKEGKNLVGGEEGKSLYGGASERATKQAGSSPPAAVRAIGRGGDDAPPSLCGTSAESSLSTSNCRLADSTKELSCFGGKKRLPAQPAANPGRSFRCGPHSSDSPWTLLDSPAHQPPLK